MKSKIVPNTNGRYVVFEDGSVFCNVLKRYIKPTKNKRGWYHIHLWIDGKRKTVNLHRVVMESFYGKSEKTVNHIDGDKSNNNLYNLEYATHKEQAQHRTNILKRGNLKRIKCLENGKVYSSIREASIDLGINTPSHISSVCRKKYGFKSVYGYHFEYYE